MQKAILVERDYKGEFERFALTPEEFEQEFGSCLAEGMLYPDNDGNTYTLRPLVHVWYCATTVGSEMWDTFFTDMEWGMAYGDIESGNLAYIRDDFMDSLKKYLPKQCKEDNTQKPSLNNLISSAESKSQTSSLNNSQQER